MLHEGPACPVDLAYLPEPQARAFRGADGRDIYASVYRRGTQPSPGRTAEPPPYVVFVHGGPTSRSPMVYDLDISYFTSRGIGIVEVDYGGSTGHGRAYRERLVRNWGLVDTADCAEVAAALAAEGSADPAGWPSAAAAPAAGPRPARSSPAASTGAGSSTIRSSTWPAGVPARRTTSSPSTWRAWSARGRRPAPCTATVPRSTGLTGSTLPFLLLQGMEDVICPPLQSERFLGRLAGRGIPHAYLTFEGEQHGFRRAETIAAALEAELSFLGQVLGFEPPDVPRLPLVT